MIRDTFIPLVVDEFVEEFTIYKILSLLDFFLGYDQVKLNERSRDMMTFVILIRLFRQCGLPMGATNSMA
jgi:hypothetical protein